MIKDFKEHFKDKIIPQMSLPILYKIGDVITSEELAAIVNTPDLSFGGRFAWPNTVEFGKLRLVKHRCARHNDLSRTFLKFELRDYTHGDGGLRTCIENGIIIHRQYTFVSKNDVDENIEETHWKCERWSDVLDFYSSMCDMGGDSIGINT